MSELRTAPPDATPVPGGWATLRSPDEVPERLRRGILRAQGNLVAFQSVLDAVTKADTPDPDAQSSDEAPSLTTTTEGAAIIDAMSEIDDATIVAFVTEWSFAAPITLDGVADLPSAAYRQLVKDVRPLLAALFVDFDANTEDKTSPTGPSVA